MNMKFKAAEEANVTFHCAEPTQLVNPNRKTLGPFIPSPLE
jgi:hypothetical protein